jgi:hypothetical protein
MAKGAPYIIDFILDSPNDLAEMNISSINDWVDRLYQTCVKTGRDRSLSEGMEFYYRPSFLGWLVKHSTPEQRALTKKLLSHIMYSIETLSCNGHVNRCIYGKDFNV